MVKTKVLASKKPQPIKKRTTKEEIDEAPIPSAKERRQKEIIEKNITEVKPSKDYRGKEDWWDDIMSYETCRTTDLNKVVTALNRCKQEGRGLNIQAMTDRGIFAFFITAMATEDDLKKPTQRRNDNAMRLHEEAKKRKDGDPTEMMLPHGTKTKERRDRL